MRDWGATMTLAHFYVIIPIQGSKREVAVRLQDIEYGPFGAQRCVPTPRLSTYECHEVRVRDGQPEARFHGEYEKLHRWNGKPQVINTLD